MQERKYITWLHRRISRINSIFRYEIIVAYVADYTDTVGSPSYTDPISNVIMVRIT